MSNAPKPVHISVADIGTNTIKVSHARVDADGTIEERADAAETIRIGAGIEETGLIAQDRIDTCLQVLRDQESLGRSLGSTVFAGVATEALRVAANGSELLDRIRRETSWDIRTITGEDEAHLTWIGLRDRIPTSGSVLIIDIGGGSTEIVRAKDDDVVASTSIPIGSGRLADRFFRADPPGIEVLQAATEFAATRVSAVDILSAKADAIVFSGGNGIFLEQLAAQLFPARALSREVIVDLIDHFAKTPASDTAARIDIAQERARVLPAGAAIALAILQHVSAESVAAAPSGIRIGLIREITHNFTHPPSS
ncbi:MAG TPA: hypothetical protein VNZ58_10725 [Thermomicrobiales bacterium]|nr:hypothetical protein [Thermomicrobiales bacterium]